MSTILIVGISAWVRYGIREYNKKQNQKSLYTFSSEEISIINSVLDKIAFTAGEIKNGIYENEWCNIQFDTSKVPQVDKNVSDSFADEKTEIGFAAADYSKSDLFVIGFEDMGAYSNIDEETYFNALKKEAQNSVKNSDVVIKFSEIYSKTIAGKEYKAVDFDYGVDNYCQTFFANAYDKKMIVLIVSANSKQKVFDRVSLIKEYHN